VTALGYDASGATLATGTRTIVLWDAAARAARAELGGFPRLRALAFARDGTQLAAAGDGRLTLLDAATLTVRHELVGHAGEVFSAAFAPDGARLFSGGRDGLLRVWDSASGDLLGELSGHRDYIWSVAVHADGTRVATGSGDFDVRRWESEPAAVTSARRARAAVMAAEAAPLVDGLLGELAPAAVAERLERDPGLAPELRQAALDELLRRAAARD